MKTLHLPIYRIYFDKILAGKKRIEYRQSTIYWTKRLKDDFDCVKFVNGYGSDKHWMIVEIKQISLVGHYYEIHLGRILEKGNI